MYDDLIAELRQYNNDGTEELRRQAADAIEELEKESEKLRSDLGTTIRELTKHRWIPVTERLPDNGVTVLAYYNNFMTEAFYANNRWHELATYATISTTHWMNLPEPPKESE